MVRRFKRSQLKVRKGNKKEARLVGYYPARCVFSAEARELGEKVCELRGLLTSRPDAWATYPDEERSLFYMVPDRQSDDNFDYQWSKDGTRSWVNLHELFEDQDINLLPGKPEAFKVTLEEEKEMNLGWCLAVHTHDRTPVADDDPEEGPGAAQDVAAGQDPGSSPD